MSSDLAGAAMAPPLVLPSHADRQISLVLRCLLAALFAAVFAAGLASRQIWICDDALIYQNYVRTALDGNGLAYAPGQMVEGYSSPLWALMLVLIGHLGATGFTAARALGACCGMLVCMLLAFMPAPRKNVWLLLAMGLLLALQPPPLWFAATGLDTPLMALVLALTALAMLRRQFACVAVLAGLAAITRPEGALYTFAAWLWLVLECRRRPEGTRSILGLTALAAAPAVAWEIFRAYTYHALIGNAAYAKLGASAILDAHSSGLGYLFESFSKLPGAWLLFACTSLLLLSEWARSRGQQRDYAAAAIVLMVVLGALFTVAVGGDWIPGARFFVPLIPLMVMLALWQYAQLAGTRRLLLAATMIIACALVTAQQLKEFSMRAGYRAKWPAQPAALLEPSRPMNAATYFAHYTLRYTVPGDTVAHFDIGQPGYLAHDVKILDQFGLVSRYEAEYLHGRHSDAQLAQHFLELSPSLVFLLVDPKTGKPVMRIAAAFEPVLAGHYTTVATATWWGENRLQVLVRNDALNRVADAARLARWQEQSPGLLFPRDHMLAETLTYTR